MTKTLEIAQIVILKKVFLTLQIIKVIKLRQMEVEYVNIINEQIEHILYGDGKVIRQEANILFMQFAEQYGVKKFIYPDAFEKYLKLNNSDIEIGVLEELHDKQTQIEAEELQKKQEYEDAIKSNALEKLKLAKSKKKTSKSKTSKAKDKSDIPVYEKPEEDNE
jgi:hypothetical protein